MFLVKISLRIEVRLALGFNCRTNMKLSVELIKISQNLKFG